ncbi:uncharacterized protein LOC134329217 [Trichomycterus rosablanca]|uniref:uncharacterized protein LOC134329217 n=1 Tax=Trichomycterus rosablanca TaxID=2290929 RepID=UPI002F35DB81
MKSNPEGTEERSSSGATQSTTSTTVSNSVLSGDPPKYKNRLFEEARKRKMPDPDFTEEQEANGSGFRGVVEVNGKRFKGSEVWKTKKEAHQDVAKIALDFMNSNPAGTEEPSLSGATQSTTSTAVSKIDEFLVLYDLSPPNVTVESVRTEKNFSFQLHINLDKFTFQTNNSFKSKKDGVSKSYGLLGQALGILPPNTDEKQVTMLVKQHFTQKSVTHPKEKFEDSMCFLHDITYDLVYEGQGFTEAEAKLDALQKAHCSVPLLFGHNALPKLNSFEETEAQINKLLNMNGQKDLTFSQTPTKYKSSIQLQFSNYTMENNSERTKKANRNQLSGRILHLLGKEPDPDSNSICKNVLDQWFTQINLQRPLFEDTKEVQGSKAAFSAPMSCSHPNWEDSSETAQQKLIQELKAKFKYLTE